MYEDLSECMTLLKLPSKHCCWLGIKTIYNNNQGLQIFCISGVKDNKNHAISCILDNDLQHSF